MPSFLAKSFRRKLILAYSILMFAIIILVNSFYASSLKNQYIENIQDNLANQAKLIIRNIDLELINNKSRSELQRISKDYAEQFETRITIIAQDGTVLSKSEKAAENIDKIENFRDKKEVKSALIGKVGSGVRFSEKLRMSMIFVAVPITKDDKVIGALRLSMPLKGVSRILYSFSAMVFWGTIIALVLIIAGGYIIATAISNPLVELTHAAEKLSDGVFPVKINTKNSDEIGRLGKALSIISYRLGDHQKGS